MSSLWDRRYCLSCETIPRVPEAPPSTESRSLRQRTHDAVIIWSYDVTKTPHLALRYQRRWISDRVAELLDRSNETGVWGLGDLWRGDLHRELGKLEAAEEWYLMLETPVVAYERLSGLYEEMGRPEEAEFATLELVW